MKCNHEGLIDTGIGYYHCPACDKGFTYNEWHNMPVKISMMVSERKKVELVAYFMGMKPIRPKDESSVLWVDKVSEEAIIFGEYTPHDDWNELMAVLKKIKKLGFYFKITDWKCVIAKQVDYSGVIANEPKTDINDEIIDIVFRAVVQFVEWFNKNNKA